MMSSDDLTDEEGFQEGIGFSHSAEDKLQLRGIDHQKGGLLLPGKHGFQPARHQFKAPEKKAPTSSSQHIATEEPTLWNDLPSKRKWTGAAAAASPWEKSPPLTRFKSGSSAASEDLEANTPMHTRASRRSDRKRYEYTEEDEKEFDRQFYADEGAVDLTQNPFLGDEKKVLCSVFSVDASLSSFLVLFLSCSLPSYPPSDTHTHTHSLLACSIHSHGTCGPPLTRSSLSKLREKWK